MFIIHPSDNDHFVRKCNLISRLNQYVLDLYLASETCATRFDFIHVKFTKYGNNIENIHNLNSVCSC